MLSEPAILKCEKSKREKGSNSRLFQFNIIELKDLRSYSAFNPHIDFAATGREHDLHVIFKGFPDRRQLELSRTLFSGIPINSIELNDEGFDIDSYAKNGIQPSPYFSKYIQPNSRPQLVEAF